MSWDPYALELVKDGKCYASGVFGRDGSTWAVSGMTLSTYDSEVDNLDTGVKDKVTVNEPALLQECSTTLGDMKSAVGLWVNGEKWQVVSNNEVANSVYFIKAGRGGCVTTTNQCMIVGLYDTSIKDNAGAMQNKGTANQIVEELAEKLKGAGY